MRAGGDVVATSSWDISDVPTGTSVEAAASKTMKHLAFSRLPEKPSADEGTVRSRA
jgi:hypothetical protein